MKMPIMMGLMISMMGCAGLPSRAAESAARAERWQGFMLRNGLGVPIELTLAEADRNWSGRLRVGSSSMPLEHVRLTTLGVHFELPGEGTFDGTVAGDSMAGSVSGSGSPGGFALTREAETPFADPITSSGP
jgi:hypothetical protein